MSLKKIISITLVLCLMVCMTEMVYAQRFKGSAVLGFNLAQIDGDDLVGFNKLGLTGGFKLDYPASKKIDVSLEMLYSERGSTASFGQDVKRTSLRYLELPLMAMLKDWYVEKGDYYKVSAHGGLSLGYLFGVSTSADNTFPGNDDLSTIDIGYILGINYRFTKRIGLTIRYTRSFNNLLSNDAGGTAQQAVGYFITARSEYYF